MIMYGVCVCVWYMIHGIHTWYMVHGTWSWSWYMKYVYVYVCMVMIHVYMIHGVHVYDVCVWCMIHGTWCTWPWCIHGNIIMILSWYHHGIVMVLS